MQSTLHKYECKSKAMQDNNPKSSICKLPLDHSTCHLGLFIMLITLQRSNCLNLFYYQE